MFWGKESDCPFISKLLSILPNYLSGHQMELVPDYRNMFHTSSFLTLTCHQFQPGCVSGIPKLRRVLLAYSIHNPETEYCQVSCFVLFYPFCIIPKKIFLATATIVGQTSEHCLQVLLQGFNRIAAIALLFMNEEDAFWALVYIVEVQEMLQ